MHTPSTTSPCASPSFAPLQVLLTGATGFIGRAIAAALRRAGHTVHTGHSPNSPRQPHAGGVAMDFARDTDAATWLPRLQGIDAVVNAVGVLRDSAARPIDAVHRDTPIALFDACAQAGVQRVVHISALGIDGSNTRYAQTKRAAEAHLQTLATQAKLRPAILRPSVVYGKGGDSSALFMNLARLPLLMLPRAAVQARVQPVAVPDVAQAVLRLLQHGGPDIVTAVGPRALTLAEYLGELRRQLGRGAATVIPLPDLPSRWSARVGDLVSAQPWSSEALSLLQQDNVGDAQAFARVLGREPTPVEQFLAAAWNRA